MLSQLLVLFGFFALVLVSVYWVNRAVVLFDQLIANGQNAIVFLEFTALSLPTVIRLVLPMSTFAATVYVTNRLSSESELTVMQATGFSPWRLARPVFLFGVIIAVMMSILTHFLVPSSTAQLSQRQKEVTENVTARLLTEGTFLHPGKGITFYIRAITPDGVLKDVFISDRRQRDEVVTYTAAKAYLVNDDDGPKLVMVDGISQILSTSDKRLFTTNFSDFAYDISSMIHRKETVSRGLPHVSTYELLTQTDAIAQEMNVGTGWVVEEVHSRFTQPLTGALAAIVGFATLLLGGYSRFGIWKQIVIAFVLLIVLEMIRNAVADPVRNDADLWPLMYLPVLVGSGLGVLLLSLSSHPIRLRRRATSRATA
nr:LPS export ABC transporter permease LptF [uncultured Shimia sp.]